MGELTDLLLRANEGDEDARQQLFANAYQELRVLARARLREGGRNTLLDTTTLVHESFLRFVQAGRLRVNDRAHFFAYAASIMRSVIVDFARQRNALRRGGDAEHVTLDTWVNESMAADENQLVDIHDALSRLEATDPQMVRIVEMRFFAGMSEAEIATALNVNERAVRRDWERARLLLSVVLRP
jgi:RNA polymerase sigma factor (TIGR02999 family)